LLVARYSLWPPVAGDFSFDLDWQVAAIAHCLD